MGYDGSSLAFVFYKNQVRRLMNESLYDERRLEVLRASRIGQPRGMINLFCAPMRGMTTAQRIEKALSRFCQRYGVTGGLTSEPKIIAIRHGPEVSHTSASLKLFNEDLNTMEVLAYTHGEYHRLTGQLLLDTANRLPNLLKRRYLDSLKKNGVSLNQPSFESLRDFVALEIEMTTSDYAQAFFKSDDKEKPKEQSGGRGEFCVRLVTVNSDGGPRQSNATAGSASETVATSGSKSFAGQRSKQLEKRPPICFYCSRTDSRHYLAECEKFKQLSPREKRQAVIESKRCLNCRSQDHFVRDYTSSSWYHTCGPRCGNKHAMALHDCYVSDRPTKVNEITPNGVDEVKTSDTNSSVQVRKVEVADGDTVLLRTCAVKVINSKTGCSTLAYAQLDTPSQATLISDKLNKELGLEDQPSICTGKTNFTLQSVINNDQFEIANAPIAPQFSDDESTLPHVVNTSVFSHFEGVKIPVLSHRKSVDILIGQSDRVLLTVLKEQKGQSPNDPSLVFTRLGPIASGGRVSGSSNYVTALRVQIEVETSDCEVCGGLRKELDTAKEALREYRSLNEEILPSKNDELTCGLVEPYIEVKDGRYEIPVPFKSEVLKTLPNNYDYALKRTLSMRRTACKNPHEDKRSRPLWYLPFFVTHAAKPRVVYDDAATTSEDASLNQVVWAGENLLINLVDVLMRFRMGKFACVADVSKCFFQIKILESQ